MRTICIQLCALGVLTVAVLAGGAVAIAQEDVSDIQFGEVVEVQLVNVEAWVTDGKGNPVLGLTADDFEVLEDGKPVDITYFSEIGAEKLRQIVTAPREEQEIPPPFTLEPPFENPNLSPAYLVLYFDQLNLTVPSRKQIIKDVRPFLDSGVVDPEKVLLLEQEEDIKPLTNFGSDRVELEQALVGLAKSGTQGTITAKQKRLVVIRLNMLWEEILNTPVRDADPCDVYVMRAKPEVELYARQAANRILMTLENLNNVASFLGGVPGVKTLIYISDTLEMTPGRDIQRVVMERCPGRPEPMQYDLPADMNMAFLNMTWSANANRVTFYTMQPSGLQGDFLNAAETRGSRFLTGTAQINTAIRESDRSGMAFIAAETGGEAIFNRNTFTKEFQQIGQEMTSYYSLAYTPPHSGDRGDHDIKVRIRGRSDLKVRHRLGYRDKGPDEQLDDRLYTALYLGLSQNPLDARLGAGAMTKVEKKRFALPLHVFIPAERMTFMPQESGSLAGMTVEVAAKDPEKDDIYRTRARFDIPEPAAGDDPTIDLVMSLRLEPGKYVIAVAVRDEVTQDTSYLSTAFEVAPETPTESDS